VPIRQKFGDLKRIATAENRLWCRKSSCQAKSAAKLEDESMLFELKKNGAASLPWAYFRLRPFPQIATRVMQLANKDDVPLHILSGLISSDPAFSSEVLTIANSPLFAPRVPASSILQAVARLGTRNIQGLCLTVAVRAYLGKSLSQPAMQAIWRHNLACAVIAEKLAASGPIDKDIAFTSGVMHDIGRLALSAIRPREYTDLLESHRGSAESILESERAMFGFDHCQAGRQLIADWRLPPAFEAAVAEHHSAPPKNAEWSMTGLINLSCRLADTAGFAAFEGCEAAGYDDLMSELPATERSLFPGDGQALAEEVGGKIKAVEGA
jgi:putative nucleotidyltransferase with HDIG domain